MIFNPSSSQGQQSVDGRGEHCYERRILELEIYQQWEHQAWVWLPVSYSPPEHHQMWSWSSQHHWSSLDNPLLNSSWEAPHHPCLNPHIKAENHPAHWLMVASCATPGHPKYYTLQFIFLFSLRGGAHIKLCSGSTPGRVWGPNRSQESNLGEQCARKASYPLYYASSSPNLKQK